jgi:hypothetical protein
METPVGSHRRASFTKTFSDYVLGGPRYVTFHVIPGIPPSTNFPCRFLLETPSRPASTPLLNRFNYLTPPPQVVEDGYEFFAKRQLVTLFSAPNYCGEFDNAGAMMSVDETLLCSFQVGSRSFSVYLRGGTRRLTTAQILKPAEKKAKYPYSNIGRQVTPPRSKGKNKNRVG